MSTTAELVLVTDLKQWAYCPRVVYYQRTMAGVGRPTHKMEEGKAAQELVETLELRRTLREYGLDSGRRRFGLWLTDDQLGLTGKLDLLIVEGGRGAVVEFKLTSGPPADNHCFQLAAYAVLAERTLRIAVDQGFFYRIPDAKVFPMAVTAELRARVHDAVPAIREMTERQWCPEATALRNRCAECEYANYCADIW